MTKHATLSPSGSVKWLNCAGAPAMEAPFPDDGNAYSKEGTAAHALASMALTEGRDCAAYIGRRVDVSPHETREVTADMARDVQVYVDNIRQYAGRLVLGAEDQGLLHDLLVEQQVPIGHITGEEGATGTADAIIVTADGEELQLHDLKFGRGMEVEAEGNTQLMMYALGALEIVAPLGYEPKRIRLVIHQPRIKQAPSEWDCTIEELQAFAVDAAQKAKMCASAMERQDVMGDGGFAHSYLNPGPHCDKGFCKAKATCPALAKYVEDQVGADFDDLDTLEGQIGTVSESTDAILGQKMAAIDLIESWCKAVRAEVERRLLAGTPVPGYKLVQGRAGSRAWSDSTMVEDYLRKTVRLKVEEAYDLKLISPTSAEKLLKTGSIKPKQWTRLQELISRSEGKPSVAPDADKRPAIEVKPVAEEFEVIA